MKRVIHTPQLSAIRFIGSFDKKLFELGGRVQPLLNPDNENIIIVSELQARLLAKSPHFEIVDMDELFANEKEPEQEKLEQKEPEQNKNTDDFPIPFLEDLETIELEDLKKVCEHFGITVGNKKIDTLKALAQPYLKNRE